MECSRKYFGKITTQLVAQYPQHGMLLVNIFLSGQPTVTVLATMHSGDCEKMHIVLK